MEGGLYLSTSNVTYVPEAIAKGKVISNPIRCSQDPCIFEAAISRKAFQASRRWCQACSAELDCCAPLHTRSQNCQLDLVILPWIKHIRFDLHVWHIDLRKEARLVIYLVILTEVHPHHHRHSVDLTSSSKSLCIVDFVQYVGLKALDCPYKFIVYGRVEIVEHASDCDGRCDRILVGWIDIENFQSHTWHSNFRDCDVQCFRGCAGTVVSLNSDSELVHSFRKVGC
mmetsp:Transcript_38588/g.96925  ORF Transcript_38588/g.96925 Transcript_38588/m.96925 type:complete len:227 (+) Transcript_38588:3209-3889(+)